MSLADVRPFCRNILDGLGYDEWTDGFNFENIPSTVFNESYHVEVTPITALAPNQTIFRFTVPVTVRLFLKGFRDPGSGIDDALGYADTILASFLAESVRLTNGSVRNILPGSINVLPYEITNDNAIILEIGFNFELIECY